MEASILWFKIRFCEAKKSEDITTVICFSVPLQGGTPNFVEEDNFYINYEFRENYRLRFEYVSYILIESYIYEHIKRQKHYPAVKLFFGRIRNEGAENAKGN